MILKNLLATSIGKCDVSQSRYHDYSNVIDEDLEQIANQSFPTKSKKMRRGPRGGVTTPFPVKLHQLLDSDLYHDIISWQPHGRCFTLRRPQEFLTEVMPKYFKQTKLTSFQRQLNLYAFKRISSGPDKGAYYHELFLRGKVALCSHMIRMRVKGTKIKSASCPENEPNFYTMPPLKKSSAADVNTVSEDDTVSSIAHSLQEDPIGFNSNESTTGSLISDQNCSFPHVPQFPPQTINKQSSPQKVHHEVQNYEPKAIMFEGKGFYYLDRFDHWDACTLPVNDSVFTQNNDLTGLSVVSGELCGFEL